jgi:hypothetical protein
MSSSAGSVAIERRRALGLTSDDLGLAFWASIAGQGPDLRLATARGVLTSVEADLRLLDGFYALYLQRAADV